MGKMTTALKILVFPEGRIPLGRRKPRRENKTIIIVIVIIIIIIIIIRINLRGGAGIT
jgi:hypothetical protein